MKKTFSLTFAAMLSAVTAVILIGGSFLSAGQAGIVAVAGLGILAAAIELGWQRGLAVFAAAGLLSLLLSPGKTTALFFLVFLGWYPAMRQFAERMRFAALRWGVKYAVLNAAVTVVFFVLRGFFSLGKLEDHVFLGYLAANAVFLPYDLFLTRLTVFYAVKISPKIRRG